ncbi:hypothetical protein ARMGADRAFT_1090116 [Armillaria gallica]|uniref:Uncharacterized protein n=1 Tax=Armillaria gallica TaxID=47427 RepID=A0A2H3CMR0_ARMGA|nr:hypothetical protein ARMGADRAFT_1090116 [Armillaria gallica]
MLITGFNGLLHLAELSMPDKKKACNWRKVTCRTTVEWIPEGYTFFLPAHKADTMFEGNKIIIPSDNDPDILCTRHSGSHLLEQFPLDHGS